MVEVIRNSGRLMMVVDTMVLNEINAYVSKAGLDEGSETELGAYG